MEVVVDKTSITLVIALYGAILSSIGILWNIHRGLMDKGKLELTGMIGVTFPGPKKSVLSFSITNIGRRPIMAYMLAGKQKRLTKKGRFIIYAPELPKMLKEGEYCTLRFDSFDTIKSNPYSLYIIDTRGKKYKMSRKRMKWLYQDYLQYEKKLKNSSS